MGAASPAATLQKPPEQKHSNSVIRRLLAVRAKRVNACIFAPDHSSEEIWEPRN